MDVADELLTTSQAAELAGVTKQTIYIAALGGRIPHQVANGGEHRAAGGGKTLLIRRADAEAYIARAAATKAKRGHGLTNAERQRRKYAKKKTESSS